jgi:hypothetical protein
MNQRLPFWSRILLVILTTWLLSGAVLELYHIGWGTGVWLGQFAPSWFAVFCAFVLFSISVLVILIGILWQPQRFDRTFIFLAAVRNKLGSLRWLIALGLLLLPVLIFQYTFWGVVIHGPYLRILLIIIVAALVGWLLTHPGDQVVDRTSLFVSLVLVAGILSIFAPLARVTSYPFSLGWSEGNRLWDYSVLFGRDIYNYPAEKTIPVFLDRSRQTVGGIPFLIPGVTIAQVRLWLALVDIVPYLILGWIAFRSTRTSWIAWILAGIWAFTFVRQGPIHPPLLICAIVVALAWRRPLWLAIPLIFAAGYYAEASRFTWLFAPAIWSVMLEFASAPELTKLVWRRSISVGLAGLLGGYIIPSYLPGTVAWVQSFAQPAASAEPVNGAGVSASQVQAALTVHPLLWKRLLPNATYGPGILLGLALAVLPLIIVLVYLAMTNRWKLNSLQKASVILPLLAFLVVGLIVSVKIGGGGDLHNLDMFIIGLMFAAAIAWRNGGYEWIRSAGSMPAWVAGSLIAMLFLPAYQPLRTMRPLSVDADLRLVVTLADIVPNDPLPDPLPDTIPSDEDTQQALQKLRNAVQTASSSGEILFMDQRQLLTFGYLENIPLVPEYDKKLLIDTAMSENAAYFETFYQDLASHRFSLIITSPVNRRLDKSEGHFAEENNAWVKWVTRPLLCYYQTLDTLKKVDVELLVPQTGPVNCEDALP